MRYSVQPATSSDVAFLAMAIEPGSTDWGGDSEKEQANRLLHTCATSTQVWAVHDKNGVPHALWGVSPKDEEGEVGCMWLLAGEQLEGAPDDFRALSAMVLGEMFAQYSRLENYVDVGKERAIELLRFVGFNVEPARTVPGSDSTCHRVWMEAEGNNSVLMAGRPLYLN